MSWVAARFPAALWAKCLREARSLFLALAALLLAFDWLIVWLTSQVDIGALGTFLQALPKEFEKLAGVPFATMATPTGRLAMAYVDPVVIFSAVAWSIARGSDCISGELGRGTMELLLAQPVRRSSVVLVQAAVTTLGAALLALAAWLGTWLGIHTVKFAAEVPPLLYVPAALNLFGLMFCLAAITTLVSALDCYRWRTVGITGGIYVVELILKLVSRVAPGLGGLRYATFLAAFEPQGLVIRPDNAWLDLLRMNGCLLALGLAAYGAAAVIFSRRDLPAPL